MRVAGFLDVVRSGLAAFVRGLGAWLADLTCLVADLIDPAMPETIWRPREWMPRLWSRDGMRSPSEARD